MRTRTFSHTNLPGLNTHKGITYSAERGGCGMRNCSCSPGHWICVSTGVDKQFILNGMTINFDNKDEMDEFIKSFKDGSYNEEEIIKLGIKASYLSVLKEEL